jgi:hypothetical protein
VIVFFLNREILKDEKDDEDIVYGQCILCEIRGKIFQKRIGSSVCTVVEKVNCITECGANENPEDGLVECGLRGDFVGRLVEDSQVDEQEKNDDEGKYPEQNSFSGAVISKQRK